jgi:hypothetical protein
MPILRPNYSSPEVAARAASLVFTGRRSIDVRTLDVSWLKPKAKTLAEAWTSPEYKASLDKAFDGLKCPVLKLYADRELTKTLDLNPAPSEGCQYCLLIGLSKCYCEAA